MKILNAGAAKRGPGEKMKVEEEKERRRMEALTGEPQDTTGVRARVGSEISSPGRMGVGCLGVPLACGLSCRPGGSAEV